MMEVIKGGGDGGGMKDGSEYNMGGMKDGSEYSSGGGGMKDGSEYRVYSSCEY